MKRIQYNLNLNARCVLQLEELEALQLKSLKIENLRSIRNLTVEFGEVTALLGGNNVGKSTVLKALQFFFDASPKISEDDYFNREDREIKITIEFDQLLQSELEEFGSAVVDGGLTVKRSIAPNTETHLQYEVLAQGYSGFSEVRAIKSKRDRLTAYHNVADLTEGLPRVRSSEQADQAMREWEIANGDQLELMFLRDFFGATNVANGKLKKKTSLNFVPAVADASDETSDTKKSPIITLLSEVSKQIYENKREVAEFLEATQNTFEKLVDPSQIPELGGISENLTSSLQKYYRDSKLLADWQTSQGVTVDFPKPSIRVEDNGFNTVLENVGHGLQRASLFAIIQFLAERALLIDDDAEFEQAQSDIILLVEEPEIYQHPNKQQTISNALHKICSEFSRTTGIRFQIVITTHSEKFVGMGKFQTARILRRINQDEGVSHTSTAVSIAQASAFFADYLGSQPMPDDTFEAKMHIFSREVCEGFFAEKCILVEGVSDKAVIEGFFRHLDRDAASEGIAIVSVDGKTKMDKPFYIFSKLGIPTFAVSDVSAYGSK